ncbi:hypothetical protein PG989_004657 [Apiospora arundinis]
MVGLTVCPATGRMDEDQDRKVTLDLFNVLLELGAPVNRESASQKRCSKPLLVLLIQCRADISVVKRVVAAGADINERYDTCAPTALASAISTRQLTVAQWLVEQGADVNVSWGGSHDVRVSILAKACGVRTLGLPFIQLLIEKGAEVDPTYEEISHSPVCLSIRSNTIDVVIMLLTHGLKTS